MLLPSFSEWLVGLLIVMGTTTALYLFGLFIAPNGHFNFIEWFGFVMLIVTFNTGRITLLQSVRVNKFIAEQKEKGVDEDDLTIGDFLDHEKKKEDADIS